MPSDPAREAFEHHVLRLAPFTDLSKDSADRYLSIGVQAGWRAWKDAWTASRAAALEEAARVCESLPVTPNRSAACAAAIRALTG